MNLKDNGYDLSVILPTYNESENIKHLIDRLSKILSNLDYEVIIVDDDSPDLTWQIAQNIGVTNNRIKTIRRLKEKGLSSAVMAGMLESNGSVIAVMDADMQHDENILPEFYRQVSAGACDICIGSREVSKGSYGDMSTLRKLASFFAKNLARIALKTSVKDPMSGFFAVSREYYRNMMNSVNPSGFKILLEFVTRGNSPRINEVGYVFKKRAFGKTKLNTAITVEYLLALIDLRFGWFIPNRFVKFCLVGVTGSLVNFLCFIIADNLGNTLSVSVFIGAELGMIWSYFLNNLFTFTPFTYHGSKFIKGLILFQLMSLFGIAIQLSIVGLIISYWPIVTSSYITLYLTYFIAVCFAAIVNYYMHAYYTWNRLGFFLTKPIRSKERSGRDLNP